MRVVEQNLAFAAVYNAVGIPLALAGLLPPWLAGAGMAASSLIVVLNALRLAEPARTLASMPPGASSRAIAAVPARPVPADASPAA
jgi:hypothetical protein